MRLQLVAPDGSYCEIEDDRSYNPEVLSDWIRLGIDGVQRMAALNIQPVADEEDG